MKRCKNGHWARLKTNKDFGCINFEEEWKYN